MKKTISVVLVLALGSAMSGLAQAATITVGPGASYDFDTIQAGIDATVDGDTVLVTSGEYVITEPITFRGKAIMVKSEAGLDETTIRMGTPADPERASVVIFENNETAESVLDGFTITGGMGFGFWAPEESEFDESGGAICFVNTSSGSVKNCALVQNRTKDAGGGVLVYSGSSAYLTNCIISENSAMEEVGGGVCCVYNSSMTMDNCIITENSATGIGLGGGVVCWGNSLVTLTGCTLAENSATLAGGGVYCGQNSSVTMAHCAIMGNTAQVGGGMDCGSGSVILANCVIAQNTATSWGGGIAFGYQDTFGTVSNCTIWGNSAGEGGGGLGCFYGASATVTNSILWGNTAAGGREIFLDESPTEFNITYSNIAGGQIGVNVEGGSILDWGVGNIDAEPYFVDLANDDYHLKSQAGRWDPDNQDWLQDEVTSPCIDGGDPDSYWKSELWPHGMRVNMGAYGNTLQASRSLSDTGNVADLNRNGIVDSADMCIMIDHWHTDEPSCDIAPAPFGDGIVDVQDLIVLAENLFEEIPSVEPIE